MLTVCGRVSSLTNVLTDIKNLLPQHDLTEWQERALNPLLDECDNVITAIGNIVDQNCCLGPSSSHGTGIKKTRRTWRRLNWDPKDVHELRSRMASNVAFLNGFIGSLTRYDIITGFYISIGLTLVAKLPWLREIPWKGCTSVRTLESGARNMRRS
jgi:hypothetical protein